MFQFFTQKKCLLSNMVIYNFIFGPRSYDAFPKWPARSFGLATPGLDCGIPNISQPYRPVTGIALLFFLLVL
jgi:hypothetical protein